MVGELDMNPFPVNHPGWRRNANLFEGYEREDGERFRQSMRLILQRQERPRQFVAHFGGWGRVTPDYNDARRQFSFFLLNLRGHSSAQYHGARGLLEWWQYWALRRIRTAVSQFVRRRIPRVARNYEAKSIIKRFRNYVPGAANVGTTLGKRRRLD